jgi:hypothetical protein
MNLMRLILRSGVILCSKLLRRYEELVQLRNSVTSLSSQTRVSSLKKNFPVLLPGNDYTSAGKFISNGSGAALSKVTNPDGSTTNLIFDVHKYLDSDNSGTHTECVTDNVADAFQPLATWLRSSGRMAILTETGGGNTASCQKYMCSQIAFLK